MLAEGKKVSGSGPVTTRRCGQPVLFVSSGEVELRAAECSAGRVPLCCPTWIVFHSWTFFKGLV